MLYKVYAKIENGRIVDVNSDAFLQCFVGWVQINEGAGDKYRHAQGNYFDKPVTNKPDETHNYRHENGQIRKATEAEIAAELAEIQAVSIETVKAAKIADSKTQLADYLEAHPLTYTNGKQYSVTAEKQSLLTSALARHQVALSSGIETILKWNATGEECVEWNYNDLASLALLIANYVEPLVAKQQLIEVAINCCKTVQQVKAIKIDYSKPLTTSVDLSDGINMDEYLRLLVSGFPIQADLDGSPIIVD